jgi:hypothetical protein
MAEIIDPTRLLALLNDFGPLRRILLGTAGTLQGTLSAYFRSPVTIAVTAQTVQQETIHRATDLACAELGVVACTAETTIHVSDSTVRELVVERRHGLGQIAVLLGVPTSFELEQAAQDVDRFWRRYRMWGSGFEFRITETFPDHLYPDAPEPL